jgi:spore coat polysaccharide biosynthesis protein SpsF
MKVDAFIQARMTSNRLPGKMLKKIGGHTLIEWTINSVSKIQGIRDVVVLTSYEQSDDILVKYMEQSDLAVKIFRGPLHNVLERFTLAIDLFRPDYILRISGDSPFVLRKIIQQEIINMRKYDIISNLMPKTFPKGLSFEIINSRLFDLDGKVLESNDKEHVTNFFYKNIQNYRFKNVKNDFVPKNMPLVIDTFQDLSKIGEFIEINHINNLDDFEELIELGPFK